MRILRPVVCLLIASLPAVAFAAQKQPAVKQPSVPSLAYVLQAEELGDERASVVAQLAKSDRDWIVMDASFHGDGESRWTAKEIQQIRKGKAGRKVIAYISVGEAEDYREYWQPSWKTSPPSFLMKENPEWAGNFSVRYWDKAWQQIILKDIDKLVSQGFDGVYLDKIDIYEDFEFDKASKDWVDDRINKATGNTFREDMITWVKIIAERCRKNDSKRMVIPQNGGQLLKVAEYRKTISGIGVEDLFSDGEKLQKKGEVKYRAKPLSLLVKDGKPVLCIDYSTNSKVQKKVIEQAKQQGFSLLVTDRDLKSLGRSFTVSDR